MARTFTVSDGLRIRDRDIPDLPLVRAELQKIAAERGILEDRLLLRAGDTARLALAAREPGEHRVRSEALKELPQWHATVGEALRRTGLLAPPRARIVTEPLVHGSCDHCLAWSNDRRTICKRCWHWRHLHPDQAPCTRCRRTLPLIAGFCRFCTLVLAETETDLAGAALEGGDQLWFGGRLAPAARTLDGREGTGDHGRFEVKRQQAQAAQRAARPVSEHLVDPGQLALWPAMPRSWSRLDQDNLPAHTEQAQQVLDGFIDYIHARGWHRHLHSGNLRTLHPVTAHLGVAAPIHEADVKAIASLSDHHNGARVINYLRRHGMLVPDSRPDPYLAQAERTAASLPKPFQTAVQTWITVLQGSGTRPGRSVQTISIRNYVNNVHPVLAGWAAVGVPDLRAITREDVEAVLKPLRGVPRSRAVHAGLRSLFRALKRERMIFRDPTRNVTLSALARRLPSPLPTDQLRGLLHKAPGARDRFMFALVAVYALTPTDLMDLQLRHLDCSNGRLTVHRTGRPAHLIYLDEQTLHLATEWLSERMRQWPDSTNPHLLVSRQTAVNDLHPRMSNEVVKKTFERLGVLPGKLREDRILDEAAHTADPLHLMRLFGLAPDTAMRYLKAAHPAAWHPDPIAP